MKKIDLIPNTGTPPPLTCYLRRGLLYLWNLILLIFFNIYVLVKSFLANCFVFLKHILWQCCSGYENQRRRNSSWFWLVFFYSIEFHIKVKSLLSFMYIFCFLERWNFIVSIHERKWILPYRFICGGSIITNNLGKTCFLILTKSEHN